MKLFSAYAGIGAFEKALTNLGIDYDLVGFSEVNEKVARSYCAIHGIDLNKNYGNILDIQELPVVDLLTYGFPCQDLSKSSTNVNRMLGMKGKRSSTVLHLLKILESNKPQLLFGENVQTLERKFRAEFDDLLNKLASLGYYNYWQKLNSIDYNVPQKRSRIYFISSLSPIDFQFPPIETRTITASDLLENDVDDNYFSSSQRLKYFEDDIKPGRYIVNNFSGELRIRDYITVIDANYYKGIDARQSRSGVAYVSNGDFKVRKLTPLECFRFMGFTDTDFYRAKAVVKFDKQLYQMAGNSITVPVLEKIFKNLFINR